MDRPTAGTVHFAGKEITKCTDDQLAVFRRKHCGFVFQQIYLLDKMSLMDNALTTGALCKCSRKELIRRARELFDMVNIPEITRKKFSSQVSGGEAQRAGIVRAVINKPEVVFADEATGALNAHNSAAVLNVFTQLYNEGQSIIMVPHDKRTALQGRKQRLEMQRGVPQERRDLRGIPLYGGRAGDQCLRHPVGNGDRLWGVSRNPCSHLLPLHRRKSRISSTSIRSRLFSFS